MKKRLAILTNKVITILGKLIGKEASVFPASIALRIDNNILSHIKYPKYVIGITGSSGKGSTTSMLAHILKESGYKVVWNKEGSNVLNGTATLILNNTSIIRNKVKADVLLLEMDESYIKDTFKKSTLTHLVVTNITRDQPARNGTPEIILNKILSSIDNKTHLILNADDSLANKMTTLHKGNITTFGIEKTLYSLDKPLSNNLDGAYCPLCNFKLIYDFYHYGHLGSYKCPSCSYKRKADYKATKLNLDKKEMFINNNKVVLNNSAFFAAYYTLAAYTVSKVINISDDKILKAINVNTPLSKRMETVRFDKRDVIMIESKNENNLSYLQSLNIINNYKDKKTIIMGFDNVSRRYKYNDISWLYDVDFEVLNLDNIEKIFCIGRFRFDVAARLLNSGINKDKLFLINDVNTIIPVLKENTKGTIFTMVCFDMTDKLKDIFSKHESGELNED